MGITFKELQNRLVGAINVIPASAAGEFINDALREIYDDYDWGFLYKEVYIRTPAIIEGTADVVKFQSTITVDAAIQTLINAITENDVGLETRQIRLVAPTIQERSFTYNIIDYDNATGVVTLDKPWQDSTNTAAKIQILKIYYTAPEYIRPYDPAIEEVPDPVIDFRRFEVVVSSQNQRRLWIDRTQEDLNKIDPRRTNYLGETTSIVPAFVDQFGNQIFEFYPISRSERLFRVKYLRKGQPLKNATDTIPDAFSKELVLAKAKQFAYEWCLANSHLIQNVGNPSRFANLIAMLQSPNNSSGYPYLLAMAKRRDEELYPQAYLGDFYIYPFYENWWDYDPNLPHDRFGDTLVIDAAAPTIEI